MTYRYSIEIESESKLDMHDVEVCVWDNRGNSKSFDGFNVTEVPTPFEPGWFRNRTGTPRISWFTSEPIPAEDWEAVEITAK